MIDAHAVTAHLQELGGPALFAQATASAATLAWLQEQLQGTTLQHEQDAQGNFWVTLPGPGDRYVVVGSSLPSPDSKEPGSNLGLVAGLETLRAVSRREHGEPPCMLKFVAWAEAAGVTLQKGAAAYLELHVEPAVEGEQTASALGMAAAGDGSGNAFHPRLTALCDEAIQELTGAPAVPVTAATPVATQIARAGTPAAVMTVSVPAVSGTEEDNNVNRLHLLQAAEAFGRWTEATMHLVAGDPVDLWAAEHRIPHV